MSDQTSRERDVLRSAMSAGPQCLSLGQLEQLLSSSADADALAHFKACPRCQSELSLLKEFEQARPRAEEGAAAAWITAQLAKRPLGTASRKPAPAQGWWRHLLGIRPISAAALAALVIVVGIFALRSRSPQEPELRAGLSHNTDVLRSGTFRIVSPIGDIEQAPAVLRWKPVAQASKYRVTIMEVDHSVLWSGEAQADELALPASAQARIVPAKTLLWQVVALGPHGQPIAESPVERFRVAQP